MKKDNCKDVKENFTLAIQKTGVGFILFIMFVLKTTNIYFDRTLTCIIPVYMRFLCDWIFKGTKTKC